MAHRVWRCAALIIRAISVLEGIALVADPEFQIIQAAYPFISRKLLTDQSPRLKAALHYMVCLLSPASALWIPYAVRPPSLQAFLRSLLARACPAA